MRTAIIVLNTIIVLLAVYWGIMLFLPPFEPEEIAWFLLMIVCFQLNLNTLDNLRR